MAFTVSLIDIDAALAEQRGFVRLPVSTEPLFSEQSVVTRVNMMQTSVLRVGFVYNLFLAADYLLAPRTFPLAVCLHLGVVTPFALIATAMMRRHPSVLVCDIMASAIPLLMIGQIMAIFALNTGESISQYQYLAILCFSYMSLNQKLQIKYAIVVSIVAAAIYLVVLLASQATFAVKFIGSTSMMTAVYLSLVNGLRIEKERRQTFLRGLREQMRREEAEAVAGQDSMTGLANRRTLESRLADLEAGSLVSNSVIAVLMVDVDHFKAFNDHYGHQEGDLCLKRLSAAMVAELRGVKDMVARYGGEEFVVLLTDTDVTEAAVTARRLRASIEILGIPHAGSRAGVVTVSIGVAAGLVAPNTSSRLIGDADTALYVAKRGGRNRIKVAGPDIGIAAA